MKRIKNKEQLNFITRFLSFIYAAKLLLFLIAGALIVSFLAAILILLMIPLMVSLKVSGRKLEKASLLEVLGSMFLTFVLLALMLKALMENLLG